MSDFRVLIRTSDILNKVPSNAGLLREGNDAANGRQGTELGAVHLVAAKDDDEPNLVDSSAGLFLKIGTDITVNSRNKIIRVGGAYVTSDGTRPDVRELNNEDVDYTGNFWYRADSHDLSINSTGEHTAEAWKSLTPRYDRSIPTPHTVGGVTEGDVFNNVTLQEALDKIFYPATDISVTAFNIEPSPTGNTQNNVIEVGASVAPPGGVNLRSLSIATEAFSSITSVSYRAGNDLDAMQPAENIFVGGSYAGLGKSRVFTYTQNNPISYAYPNKFYWEALLTDGEGTVRPGPNRYVEWAYRCFSFSSSASSIANVNVVSTYTTKVTEAGGSFGQVLGYDQPQATLSRLEKAGKQVTDAAEYLYIFLPIGREVGVDYIEDGYAPYTSFMYNYGAGVAMDSPSTIVIARNNVDVRYLAYRSSVATKAAYTIDLY